MIIPGPTRRSKSPVTLITRWLECFLTGQEVRYIGSATGHHLVKVFSPANRQARGVRRRDTSFLGGSIHRIAERVRINASCHAKNAPTCLYFFLPSARVFFLVVLPYQHPIIVTDQWEELKIYRLVREAPYCFTLIWFRNVMSATRTG